MEIPNDIVKEINDALEQFSNVLYDGVFSLDKLPVSNEIKKDFIKKRGEIEALNKRLYEHAYAHADECIEEALKEIQSNQIRTTDERLKRLDKKSKINKL